MLSRFEVPAAEAARFVGQARAAIAVLQTRPGFASADLGCNVDDPDLWTLTTRWVDIGSYRRALQGYESKTVVAPLLSLAIDEPSAYVDPDEL